MLWNLHWTVQQMALEVARVAHEGLGNTLFEQLKAIFRQEIERQDANEEMQLRIVTRLLIEKTAGPVSLNEKADIRTVGFCYMWLANTRVSEWTLLELYRWGASLV